MKKLVAILLGFVMAVSAAACANTGGSSAPPAASASSKSDAAAAPEVYKLTLGSYYAEEHVFYDWVAEFADKVKKDSDGRLVITCYQNGQLGDEAELVNSLSMGTLDMAIGLGPGQMGSLYAPVQVFDAPYALQDKNHIDNVAKSDWGKKLFDDLAKETKIRELSFLYQGKRFITTSRKAIKEPSDLAGLKLRTPDQEMSIANFNAYGASATPMAFSEVYLALQQGVVDGQENPLSQIVSAKLYEVQKYISLTGHVVQSTTMCINQDKLDALPQDLQEILIKDAYDGQFEANDRMEKWENDTLDKLEGLGMTIVEPDVDAFKAISANVVKKYEDVWGAGLYEQLTELAG